jgi:ubiquinone/menaquinone biosynthesis C-methylase UbiE
MTDQWWNRTRYQLYAPVYDWLATPWEAGRQRAIERLAPEPDDRILILGCGTGGDLEYLPSGAEVVAIDLSPAMVRRTEARAERLDREVDARVGDAQSLPFDDDRFDAVLLHLVLSVVPDPEAVVSETARVLDADGRVSIYDKFVPADETPSLARRAVNPLTSFLFADVTRSLDPLLAGTCLRTGERETVLGGLYWVTSARPAADRPRATDESTGRRAGRVPRSDRW